MARYGKIGTEYYEYSPTKIIPLAIQVEFWQYGPKPILNNPSEIFYLSHLWNMGVPEVMNPQWLNPSVQNVIIIYKIN